MREPSFRWGIAINGAWVWRPTRSARCGGIWWYRKAAAQGDADALAKLKEKGAVGKAAASTARAPE